MRKPLSLDHSVTMQNEYGRSDGRGNPTLAL
jgi:hypothetical protein